MEIRGGMAIDESAHFKVRFTPAGFDGARGLRWTDWVLDFVGSFGIAESSFCAGAAVGLAEKGTWGRSKQADVQ